ncbi:MAG: hypothetical protein MO846_11520, partial [Candidatus Devosia symbiotica]|nr:hypothetical protein [Candidatus Devosia symbiotica]
SLAVEVEMALARWSDPEQATYVTSTGPFTGDRLAFQRATIVAYILTKAPEGLASVKFAECIGDRSGHLDQVLVEDYAT